jgi:class 3 adenylate cyclase/tetratricopeptide (TPR) repeat protein
MKNCPNCGRDNADDASFCSGCGTALSGVVQREERKVVTVLFCDLVGSTARAEQLDPEDVRALLSRYHEHVRRELERFGGTVEKFIGDAVMALFGAPVAHEDDPERAVRAALAVRDWAQEGDQLRVRIGITTGEALVSLQANPHKGEGMAAGDVVNTAARLQSAAAENGILVDETTYRAASRAIDFGGARTVDAKGKAKPIRAWDAVQARSRFGTDVRQIGRTPLVGREQELDVLADALDRARSAGEPQLVTLVGVPGIGKSRLVWELFKLVDAMPGLTRWRQGRSLPYGEGVSFWALGEMVKAEAGILETDGGPQAAARLAQMVHALVLDDAEWVESHLRPLVGLEAAVEFGGDRRGEAFAAWRRFVEALGEHRPTVLVFEDLHWADEGLLDFVDHLVEWVSGVPLLVVATARPELLTRRPNWGGGKPNATTLSLSSLSDEETARLVHALLDRSVLPAEMQASLLARAGGNPLYAEEFVRLVQERPEEAALPESVQGIIAARLDALTAEEKELVQDAAVLGKVFWLGGLVDGRTRWGVEELLHALERKEFVRRERRSSVAGEVEFAFRHALVREVAYEQIPRGRRAKKHVAAAAWIESLGRPDDHAEMLAHHYLSALELARATGVDVGAIAAQARSALHDAGDRAFALNAFAAAARFYEEALELDSAAADRTILLFRLAQARYLLGDGRRERTLQTARDALLASGDPERAAHAEALLAELWWHRGSNERAAEHLGRARELVAERPASEAKALVLTDLARFHVLAEEDADAALRVGEEAVAMARALGHPEIEARALNNIGIAKCRRWDLTGIDDLKRSIEVAQAANSPEAARGHNNLGAILWELGEWEGSRRESADAVRVGEELGNAAVTEYSRIIVIEEQFWLGRWDEALSKYEELLTTWERGEGHYLENTVRTDRAFARLARDDVEGALADVRRAIERAREAKDPQALFPTLGAAIRIFAEAGYVEEARPLAAEMLAHPSADALVTSLVDVGAVAEEVGVTEDVRRAAQRLPDVTKWKGIALAHAEGDHAGAAEQYDALGMPVSAARARLAAAKRLAAAGRHVEARAQLERALPMFRSLRATRYLREAESLLAASA